MNWFGRSVVRPLVTVVAFVALNAPVIVASLAAALVAASSIGCAPSRGAWGDREGASPATIYLYTDDMAYIVPVTVDLRRDRAVREAARLVVEWPGGGALRSPFPEGSRLRSVEVDGTVARVRASIGDGALDESGIARAMEALAWTLTGFPEVKRVSLVAGATEMGPAPRPPFINHVGPKAWDCSMKVVLWFAYRGAYLVPVTRFVPRSAFPHVSAMQQLIAGPPDGATLARTIPDGMALLSLSVEGGTCTVDMSARSATARPAGGAMEDLALQSIVLTLTEFVDVRAVRLLIGGKSDAGLGGHVILDAPVMRGTINPTYPGTN